MNAYVVSLVQRDHPQVKGTCQLPLVVGSMRVLDRAVARAKAIERSLGPHGRLFVKVVVRGERGTSAVPAYESMKPYLPDVVR